MADPEVRLFELLEHLDRSDDTVVSSVRQPKVLREALKAAVDAGMDTSANDAIVHALRDRVETFAQRLAQDRHYDEHPHARPSLADLAIAAADLDGDPLAAQPDLLRLAAHEVSALKSDPTSDDVLVYAAALASRRATA